MPSTPTFTPLPTLSLPLTYSPTPPRHPAGEVTPAAALDTLSSGGNAVLVDIRSGREKEQAGLPELPNSSKSYHCKPKQCDDLIFWLMWASARPREGAGRRILILVHGSMAGCPLATHTPTRHAL